MTTHGNWILLVHNRCVRGMVRGLTVCVWCRVWPPVRSSRHTDAGCPHPQHKLDLTNQQHIHTSPSTQTGPHQPTTHTHLTLNTNWTSPTNNTYKPHPQHKLDLTNQQHIHTSPSTQTGPHQPTTHTHLTLNTNWTSPTNNTYTPHPQHKLDLQPTNNTYTHTALPTTASCSMFTLENSPNMITVISTKMTSDHQTIIA